MPLMYHPNERIEMDSGPAAPHNPASLPGYRISIGYVDPRFFDVIEAPVLRGRSLTSADAEQHTRAIVVNEMFVTRVMAGHNPIGRRFRFVSAEDNRSVAGANARPWYEIVGVVPNLGIDSNIQGTSAARIYAATLPKEMGLFQVAIHVRGEPQRFTPRLRDLALAIDPALRVADPKALPHVMDTEIQLAAFMYQLLAGFAVVALVLSLAGVYSVTAFAVAKRTREIGVRVALGASPKQIIVTTFKRPFIQMALGIAAAALMMSIIVIAETAKPGAPEFVRLGIVVVLIGVCCMMACIVPARRALRIQPTEALKDDG